MTYEILAGDCRASMRTLAEQSVQTCITSPPYFGLRDYGHAGQIGLEQSPAAYVEQLVEVFREVRRVLRDDGTLWLNLGDSYAGSGRGGYPGGKSGLNGSHEGQDESRVAREKITGGTAREAAVTQRGSRLPAGFHEKARLAGTVSRSWSPPPVGFKQKDLIGIPWRVAFALQADGWYLRQDIIWSKPNPMPESVRDRCTKAHEYLFLLAKSERYYFDADAISEQCALSSIERLAQNVEAQAGSDRGNAGMRREGRPMKAVGRKSAVAHPGAPRQSKIHETTAHGSMLYERRNKRSVWTVSTKPYDGAHFAVFPPDLIEPCVLAGSRDGDLVLDPFGGSGTTAQVALKHRRRAVLCELNPAYIALARQRLAVLQPELCLVNA